MVGTGRLERQEILDHLVQPVLQEKLDPRVSRVRPDLRATLV